MNVLSKLAEYPADALLDQAALAEALGVTKRAVRYLVARNELPPPFALCGKRWLAGKVREFLNARQDQAIREAEAAAEHEARLLGEIPAVPRRRAR